jgi:pimeloyl-ACP methyl ester carboxylesterase
MENIRKYGQPPFDAAVIHGGPGAAGEMAPVARELSHNTGVLEPLQTSASLEGQLRELQDTLEKHGDLPVTLLGFSWGAMLSYIFAARCPLVVRKLILIGSGPYEEEYASNIMETRLNRLTNEERRQARILMESLNNPDVKNKNAILARFGQLMSKADSFNPLPFDDEEVDCQYEIYRGVWKEARELRQSRKLLELGKQIRCPVVAIHGDYDPHPFAGVNTPLSQIIKDFRFILLKECGHKPWVEKNARDRFFQILREELVN